MLQWMMRVTIALLLAYTAGETGRADLFQNLGFEEADLRSVYYYEVPASEALPHWTALNDYLFYDTIALDTSFVSIHDAQSILAQWFMFPPIEGHYMVLLQSAIGDFGPPLWPNGPRGPNAFVSQVGDVPADAKSLLFASYRPGSWSEGDFVVSMNGTVVPTRPYSGFVYPHNYIADISTFAGQRGVELRFELMHAPGEQDHPGSYYSWMTLDAIKFSRIPEPSMLVLIGIGTASLLAWRRRPR